MLMLITKQLGATLALPLLDNPRVVAMASFGQGRLVLVVRLFPRVIVNATNTVDVIRLLAIRVTPTLGK